MSKKCQYCGTVTNDAACFCPKCGAGTSAAAGWVRATAEAPMTHCDKCNRQVPIRDDTLYCPYCHAEIHEPTGPGCPVCGTQMQDNERTCVVCGADIPGRFDKKPIKGFFSMLVYKKPTGLYGISIVGWLVILLLAIACWGIVALITSII